MKLATLRNGTRDGRLVVVSRDLTRYTDASFLVPTLQGALDDWRRLAPHLAAMAQSLEADAVPSARFHENDALSPLPRAYQWLDGRVGPSHGEPLLNRGGSDAFAAPREPIRVAGEGSGVEVGARIAAIVGDVPISAGRQEASEAVRLIVLLNDVSAPPLGGVEPFNGSGVFEGKPPAALSPVAVTPDELGEAWDGGKVGLPLLVDRNGKPQGRADAGAGMAFDFPALIVHAARMRPLGAGAVISVGAASSKASLGAGEGKTVSAGSFDFGDTVRIEMKDGSGRSVFGAIERTVEKYAR